jgi:hypothetical protein
LESIPVQSPESEHPPPSFDAIHTNSEDTSAKELPVAEDNMKYPQSMKINITKGVKAAEGDASKQMYVATRLIPGAFLLTISDLDHRMPVRQLGGK